MKRLVSTIAAIVVSVIAASAQQSLSDEFAYKVAENG